MEIWLDTTNPETIQQAVRLGILTGITTNPSLIASSQKEMSPLLESLLELQEGPVTVQVVAEDANEMVQQGQALYSFSNRIIVKVPMTRNGLEAIHQLASQGIPTMATVIFHSRQALMAALAGAYYVAPYLSRIEAGGEDPRKMLTTTLEMFHNYRLQTKVLGASLTSVEQVVKCAELGIYGITVKDKLFEKLIEDHPLTLEGVDKFAEDWKSVSNSLFIQ
jgi:transaldolase